ncbi:MAG: menaquinone biosynthetic enzyme MqnA/MqnD family protein [Gammaproteobacteria bacterium]
MNYYIAITSYLNTRPLYYHALPPDFKVLALPPAATVSALMKGEIDAGIVPVAGLPLLGGEFELLGPYGIACDGPVLSVALFSKLPFEEFGQHHRVMLSPESMTSNKLLFLLFAYRGVLKKGPALATGQPADGELVIGDRALLRYYAGSDPFITDLSGRWEQINHKPFVFARWVVRKNAAPSLKTGMLNWLAAFIDEEPALREETVAREIPNYRPLSGEQMLDYLCRIRHFIGEREQLGQNRFLDEIKGLPKIHATSAASGTTLLKAS